MEREDWVKTGLVAGGAVLGLLGEKLVKSKLMKKALVKSTAAALRVQKCASESTACLQAQADDIVAAAKEENKKIEEASCRREVASPKRRLSKTLRNKPRSLGSKQGSESHEISNSK